MGQRQTHRLLDTNEADSQFNKNKSMHDTTRSLRGTLYVYVHRPNVFYNRETLRYSPATSPLVLRLYPHLMLIFHSFNRFVISLSSRNHIR